MGIARQTSRVKCKAAAKWYFYDFTFHGEGVLKMSVIITTAIYEDGILRLLEPLNLPAKQRARITIEAIPAEEAEEEADPPFWFPDENPPPQNLNDLLRETPPEYFVEGYSAAGIPTRAEFESALRSYEIAHDMSSPDFYEKWQRREMPDEIEFIMWAALYESSLEDLLFIDETPLEEIVGVLGE